MKAAFIRETGAPDVIQYGDFPEPELGPGRVLVKVGAAAINPIETYIRSGAVKMNIPLPYIPGCDLAGTVTAVAPDITRFKVGDRVWGSNQGLFGRQGTLAEIASVEERWLYPTPDGLSDPEAAAGALVGITAHLGLSLHAGLQPGELVFVNGGTGGVGSSVVQLAKAMGAKVIATVGNAQKEALARQLGADEVLDYHLPDLDDRIRKFAEPHGGINLWWETQREPTFDRTISLMAPRGRIVLMAGRAARPEFPVGPFYVKDLRLVGFAMFNATSDEQQVAGAAINATFAAGNWRPQIGEFFPLAQAAEAHRHQEQNTLEKAGSLTGKIVVIP